MLINNYFKIFPHCVRQSKATMSKILPFQIISHALIFSLKITCRKAYNPINIHSFLTSLELLLMSMKWYSYFSNSTCQMAQTFHRISSAFSTGLGVFQREEEGYVRRIEDTCKKSEHMLNHWVKIEEKM